MSNYLRFYFCLSDNRVWLNLKWSEVASDTEKNLQFLLNTFKYQLNKVESIKNNVIFKCDNINLINMIRKRTD